MSLIACLLIFLQRDAMLGLYTLGPRVRLHTCSYVDIASDLG